MRDLHHNLSFAPAINPAAIASNTATHGVIIDTKGFDSLEFVIQSGTLTDGTYTPSLIEGDDPTLSDGAAVTAGDLLGTVAGATFAATDDNKVKKIGYRGNKRYVRLTITSAGVTTGGTLGAVAVQGHPRSAPVDLGNSGTGCRLVLGAVAGSPVAVEGRGDRGGLQLAPSTWRMACTRY